jgi:hypothetical protein
VALYACYIGVGWRVLGYLPAYAGEEGVGRGGGIWLLAGLSKLIALPPDATIAYLLLAAAGFAWLGSIMSGHAPLDRSEDVVRTCGNTAILAAAATCAISAHYPWYFAWLAVPSCIVPYRSVVFLSAAALLLYLNPLDERFWWPALLYLPAIGLAVFDVKRHRRQRVFAIGAIGRSA